MDQRMVNKNNRNYKLASIYSIYEAQSVFSRTRKHSICMKISSCEKERLSILIIRGKNQLEINYIYIYVSRAAKPLVNGGQTHIFSSDRDTVVRTARVKCRAEEPSDTTSVKYAHTRKTQNFVARFDLIEVEDTGRCRWEHARACRRRCAGVCRFRRACVCNIRVFE